jgi:hypothetical protein
LLLYERRFYALNLFCHAGMQVFKMNVVFADIPDKRDKADNLYAAGEDECSFPAIELSDEP